MSIIKKEILKNKENEYKDDYTPEIDKNIETLLIVMNKLRDKYGKPLIVSSGWRPKSYNEKVGGAKNSLHITGHAVDFADPKGELGKWVLENEDFLKEIGIWCEHPKYTKGWVHCQIKPPKSGNRFYKP